MISDRTISDAIEYTYKEAKAKGFDLKSIGIDSGEELVVFALNYLVSNLDHIMEGADV